MHACTEVLELESDSALVSAGGQRHTGMLGVLRAVYTCTHTQTANAGSMWQFSDMMWRSYR